jgi:hypothetical protein
VRKHLAEPAGGSHQQKYEAENPNGSVRHHAGEQERDAERKHHRPYGRGRKLKFLNIVGSLIALQRVLLSLG